MVADLVFCLEKVAICRLSFAMQIAIHHYHHHSESLKGILMAISAEVQTILDQARANSVLVTSIDLRQKAMEKQISDLQAQIAALPVGTPLGADDKAALLEASGDMATSISTLTADTTANTPPAAPVAPAVPPAA